MLLNIQVASSQKGVSVQETGSPVSYSSLLDVSLPILVSAQSVLSTLILVLLKSRTPLLAGFQTKANGTPIKRCYLEVQSSVLGRTQ